MKTRIYLLTITVLFCLSCKDKKANTEQTNTPLSDTTIQKIVENALYNQLEGLNADAGIAIVMEAETGIIKAIANNNFSENDSIEIGGLFSTVSMMIALDDNIVSLNDKIDVGNGETQYSGQTLRDHNFNRGGYGEITAKQIIPFASNIGIAKVILKGYENNPQKFINRLNQLGFTNILEYENWRKTTLAWLSFGYEVQVTPIQMLEFYNSIANKTVKCSSSTLKTMQEILVDVVNTDVGVGKPAKSDKILIAGKTGTLQLEQSKYRVSFCGYFPADNPKYSCIVIIDNPKSGVPSGGVMAGSIFNEIAEGISQSEVPKPTIIPTKEYKVNIQYKQKINGFNVEISYSTVKDTGGISIAWGDADIKLTSKDGTIYEVSVDFFKAPWDEIGYNEKDLWEREDFLKEVDGKTIILDYTPNKVTSNEFGLFDFGVSFFFADIDFDGKKELIFNNGGSAQRGTNYYRVYQLSNGKVILNNTFNEQAIDGLDTFVRFNKKKKEVRIRITCGYCCDSYYIYKYDPNKNLYLVRKVDCDSYTNSDGLCLNEITTYHYQWNNGIMELKDSTIVVKKEKLDKYF